MFSADQPKCTSACPLPGRGALWHFIWAAVASPTAGRRAGGGTARSLKEMPDVAIIGLQIGLGVGIEVSVVGTAGGFGVGPGVSVVGTD